jgi:hypothetical protein
MDMIIRDEQKMLIARMLEKLRRGSDVRKPKLQRIKRLLVAGIYENDLKLEVAADRILGEVSDDEGEVV